MIQRRPTPRGFALALHGNIRHGPELQRHGSLWVYCRRPAAVRVRNAANSLVLGCQNGTHQTIERWGEHRSWMSIARWVNTTIILHPTVADRCCGVSSTKHVAWAAPHPPSTANPSHLIPPPPSPSAWVIPCHTTVVRRRIQDPRHRQCHRLRVMCRWVVWMGLIAIPDVGGDHRVHVCCCCCCFV